MEYRLRYISKEYPHGWSVWLERDGKKFMIGSALKSEKEVNELINSIKLENKEYCLSATNKINQKITVNENKVFEKSNDEINRLMDIYNDYITLHKMFGDQEYLDKANKMMSKIKNITD